MHVQCACTRLFSRRGNGMGTGIDLTNQVAKKLVSLLAVFLERFVKARWTDRQMDRQTDGQMNMHHDGCINKNLALPVQHMEY